MRRHRVGDGWWLAFCLPLLALHGTAHAGNVSNERWILVDTGSNTLLVLRGDRLLDRFDNVAVGRGGPSLDKVRDDGATPLGEFRIDRINRSSRFLLFFGIDYPRPEHARRALEAGRIDASQYHQIVLAFEENKPPPQDTPLGGQLGIHGLGDGDPRVHEMLNWTQGCIALTNEQIRRLSRWIRLGMRVEVR